MNTVTAKERDIVILSAVVVDAAEKIQVYGLDAIKC